jgi:hypothetical protein
MLIFDAKYYSILCHIKLNEFYSGYSLLMETVHQFLSTCDELTLILNFDCALMEFIIRYEEQIQQISNSTITCNMTL